MKKQVTVHTFAAFHYDVAYRKTFEDYLRQTLPIIDRGLDMLQRHPEFVFAVEQVIVMQAYLERFPTAWPTVRKLAREGRLVFAPGMYTMPDVNLPSGESFIRNFRMGRDWLVQHLGVEPTICWMADIFGHHAQMPQIARACGFRAYLFERGMTGKGDVLFWWQGLDGSRLLAQWQVDTYYGIGLPMTPMLTERGDAWVGDFLEHALLDRMHSDSVVKDELLSPLGGDFKMPDEAWFRHIAAYNRQIRKYRIAFGSPEAYFDRVIRRHGRRLPVRTGDFNPMMQGTYTSRIRIKQANRRIEQGLAALELLESVAAPAEPMAPRIWERLAYHAFHDIICGTLVDDALHEALYDYACTERLLGRVLAERMVALPARRSPAAQVKAELAVAVMNSLPYPRRELIEIPLKGLGKDIRGAAVTDADGKPVASQLLVASRAGVPLLDVVGEEIKGAGTVGGQAGDRDYTLLAEVGLPAAGLRTFGIRLETTAGGNPKKRRGLKATARVLENRFLKATFGANGTIISLVDKAGGVELADPGRGILTQKGMNNIQLQPDRGDLWQNRRGPQNGTQLYARAEADPMAVAGIEYDRLPPVANTSADADATHWPEITVVEAGPLRAAIRVRYADLNITTTVSLAHDEKLLRFRTVFVPAGKRYRLRVAFPTAIRQGRIRTSIPCGHLEREEGEHPAQGWMDYADGKRGLCLLNRGLPGNNVTDGVLLLSLFRAVGMEDYGETTYEAGIEQVFDYALHPFDPRDPGYHPERLAAAFNRPFETACPAVDEPWPELDSVIEVSAPHVELMACRRVDGDLEVRLFESEGRAGEVTLTLAQPVRACRLTDARGLPAERPAATVAGRRVTLDVRPFEMATLRLTC